MARDYARGNALNRQRGLRFQRAFAIDGTPQGVYHATKQFRAHRHFENPLRATRRHAFGQALVVAEHHDADGIAFQVQRHAVEPAGEFDHLAVLGFGEAVDADDPVRYADDGSLVLRLRRDIEVLYPLLDDVADF